MYLWILWYYNIKLDIWEFHIMGISNSFKFDFLLLDNIMMAGSLWRDVIVQLQYTFLT